MLAWLVTLFVFGTVAQIVMIAYLLPGASRLVASRR
jgi:hypothetical protein